MENKNPIIEEGKEPEPISEQSESFRHLSKTEREHLLLQEDTNAISVLYGYVNDGESFIDYKCFKKTLEVLRNNDIDVLERHRVLHDGSVNFDNIVQRVQDSPFDISVIYKDDPSLIMYSDELNSVVRLYINNPENYTQTRFTVYSTPENLEKVKDLLEKHVSHDAITNGHKYNLKWVLQTSTGFTKQHETKLLTDEVIDEAYPYLQTGVDEFANEYLNSDATLLLLYGKQGTGKTRFIRNIVKNACKKWSNKPDVIYTSDKKTMKSEKLFMELTINENDFLILEGADDLLFSRKDDLSNSVVHKFLSVSDGFASSNRKIILSTNMDLESVDEALIRPGRCFAVQEFKELTVDQANKLIDQLDPECSRSAETSMTIAEVYHLVFDYSKESNYHPKDVEFRTDKNGIGFSS